MLALATFAYYGRHLSGIWRPIYTITAVLPLYLNVFVVIIPSFLKIPPLKSWAPTQTEPAFLVVQGSVLVLFIVLAILTTVRFRHSPAHPNDNPSGSAPEVHGNLVFTFGQTSPKKLRVDR